MSTRAVITGIGGYLPEKIVTNADLEKTLDTSDSWIRERTGITQRHIAAEDQYTSDLGAKAAEDALKHAGLQANDIDLILLATSTPDDTLPATAVKIQHKLGMDHGAAFDLNAVCSGFLYGLMTANAFITSGSAGRVLVIGAETYSRILDWDDRGTCILFGDGAGAVVLEAARGDGSTNDRGILACEIQSDGQYADLLGSNGGVSTTQTAGTLFMQGKEVFRHAVAKMADSVLHLCEQTGIPLEDIDWLAPHQANARILQSCAKRLNMADENVILTVDRHANTSSASIPLALWTAERADKLKKGNIIACPALGAGLTWGSCLIRW